MAFTTDNLLNDGDIEVIVRQDSALDVTDEEYAEYIRTCDEELLKFKDGEEPTRFVMKRQISLKHATAIENAKVRYDQSGDMTLQLGFIFMEIRACLKEIKNPPSVPKDKQIVLKFTGDGLLEEKLMANLVASGIVTNLYNARQAFVSKMQRRDGDLKKS